MTISTHGLPERSTAAVEKLGHVEPNDLEKRLHEGKLAFTQPDVQLTYPHSRDGHMTPRVQLEKRDSHALTVFRQA